ncbi:MAG: Gfo/Idh/MocA family oxidoreductase [Kiritimatiellae bacterium]|nr:Gfo/Idh/MocA family oxidoreductase [Kiritimatiellia bacterium]
MGRKPICDLGKPLRVGLIGAGGMADYHVAGFKKAGAEVVAIADPDPEAAEAAAAKFEISNVYDTAEEMLAREKLDAVSVITPNKFHCPLVLKALKAGKHVFCEKPPALNAKEAANMARAAKNARRILMFDFNNRARPESIAMKEAIARGDAGRINSAQALWIRRTGIPGFGGWFTTKALSGGGPVIDLLHMIDLALHFMGYPEPKYVMAATFRDFIADKRFKGPWGIPDKVGGICDVEAAAHGFVSFKNGSVLYLRTSWAEMNKREEVSVTFQGTTAGGMVRRLFGKDGIDSTAEDTCEMYFQDASGAPADKTIKVEKDQMMGRVRAAENFINVILKKEKPLNSPDEAVRLMKIVDAIYASAKSGAPIKLK